MSEHLPRLRDLRAHPDGPGRSMVAALRYMLAGCRAQAAKHPSRWMLRSMLGYTRSIRAEIAAGRKLIVDVLAAVLFAVVRKAAGASPAAALCPEGDRRSEGLPAASAVMVRSLVIAPGAPCVPVAA